MEFDEELSVSGSESDHRPPPDLQHSETVPASVASAGRSHEPSPGSGDPMPESHDEEVQQPLMVDPEMARLENQMDIWCLDLKRNVMVNQNLPIFSDYSLHNYFLAGGKESKFLFLACGL